MKEFTIKAADGLDLSIALFEHDNPKAIIQIIHGAKEHKGRYYDLADFLNKIGYAVIISDNRGHGHSVNAKYFLGHFDSSLQIVDDQHIITKYVKNLYPGKKLYLYGHSFGSMLARIYLQNYDDEISKLLLTGTVFPIKVAKFGMTFCNISVKIHGSNSLKGLASKVSNSSGDSWVCDNPQTMTLYRKDNLVQECKYTNGAAMAMVESNILINKKSMYMCNNPGLLIMTINGMNDPCIGTYKGLHRSVKALNKFGYKHIYAITYPGMKHEVINEIDKGSVYEDIARFFDC